MVRRSICCLVAAFISATAMSGQGQTPGEIRGERVLESAKKAGNSELYALLRTMPKGADLHMHLSGAVYAETFIAEGAQDGLCAAPVERGTPPVPVGQGALHFVVPQYDQPNNCAAGQAPVSDAFKNQALYDSIVDSFSMRAYVATQGINGHDQFFATFARWSGLKDHAGEWLDEVATRAAAQNEQYLEIMQTPTFAQAAALGYRIGWSYDVDHDTHIESFARLRDQLLAAGLREEVAVDRREFEQAEVKREQIEGCADERAAFDHKEGQASLHHDNPALVKHTSDFVSSPCSVKIRFLYQVLRGFPPQQVFAQTLLGFEVAQAELQTGRPLVVGINFVMPEDGYLSMRDYHLQMQMLDYLHSVYPKVHISLHAGELAPGMVPPAGLSFHVREAVNLGHAERIGHGVDVLYEDNPLHLLHEMASRHIMVEVNLTSNDVILDVAGADHPLHAYIAAHVPFALSTDDEGVSRIDLTHEYVKAADDQDLSYAELKQSARASLEHSFLHGESLYTTPDDFAHRKPACAATITTSNMPSRACQALLDANEKAAQQWELERRFAVYEASLR
jgi:adenosine deaminase